MTKARLFSGLFFGVSITGERLPILGPNYAGKKHLNYRDISVPWLG